MRIVAWMMQQEELESELLNVLGLYVCAKWSELPVDEQTLALGEEEEEEEVNDDDIVRIPICKPYSYALIFRELSSSRTSKMPVSTSTLIL